MDRKHRPAKASAGWRQRKSSSSRRRPKSLEHLERRQLLAAHIVGSGTVYATIQAAVDAAVAGQTVTVDPGTYAEAARYSC